MRLATPVLLLLALVPACGGSDDDTTPDSGTAADAATTPDASASPDAAPTPTNVGFITLISDTAPAHARASATFLAGGPAFVCTETPAGACTLYRCSPRPGANARPAPHAGTIQLTGLSQALSFTPATDGTYPVSVLATTSLWTGGETLTVSAPGATVPAFTSTLALPGRVTLSAPIFPTGDWLLDRATPITFTWMGATTEDIVVTLGANTVNPLELECVFPAISTTSSIPAAALGLLPAGDAYYSIVSRTRRSLDVPAWRITLRAETDAILRDARLATGSAVLR